MNEYKVTIGNDSSNEASTSKSSPAPVYQRKRGRPRKGTYVPRSSSLNLSCFNEGSKVKKSNVKRKKKRNYDSIEEREGNNSSLDMATEQSCSRENSKRRRQPKVLDDYVTDFNSSDEEGEKFCGSSPFQSSKQRRGVSKGKNKKVGEMDCLESDNIFSYLGNFDKNFADQELFGSEFLEGDHEGSEEDISGETSKDTLVGDTNCESKLSAEVTSPESEQQDSDLKDTEGAIFTSKEKEREWKQTVR
ncbi:uncharacterized protein [Palaemon carinicauda]|uniref:uncharacterized protein n=1 Tax=Palaemon carinicauda TaxID=392227 RepID=UPI0035B59070